MLPGFTAPVTLAPSSFNSARGLTSAAGYQVLPAAGRDLTAAAICLACIRNVRTVEGCYLPCLSFLGPPSDGLYPVYLPTELFR